MARIYDVVCPRCGEIISWCKYDPPASVSPCPTCGFELVDKSGEFKPDVVVFGVGATGRDVEEYSKAVLRRLVEKIVDSNYWLSRQAEADEGDPLAGLENREMLCNVVKVENVSELYENLRNYVGTFKHRHLLLINHPTYGCFVYDLRKPESYVEHLTVDAITFEKFIKILERLTSNRES